MFFFSPLFYSHALCSPAYLPEHVDHVDSSGGCYARGVINGMMQRPLLLHRGPHTCTPPSFIYHLAIFLSKKYAAVSRLTGAEKATCALAAGLCVRVCVHERVLLTCRAYHRMYATRFPCAKRKCINLFTFLEPAVVFISHKGHLLSLALASQTISPLNINGPLNIRIINN